MKLSAWDIYLVMQLDAIGFFSLMVTIALAGIAVSSFISIWRNQDFAEIYEDSPECKSYQKYMASANSSNKLAWRTFPVAIVFALISALLPSSKTAAAMLILPAIVNNEAIQQEAGDLYRLAKQGLSELVKPDRKPAPTERVEK
jgi:hypothetical protein